MFETSIALKWDYDMMRLAAAREAVLTLGLLVPSAEARIYHFLDEGLTDHPTARCRAWRKHGEQMTPEEKKAAGIQPRAFYSREAFVELTDTGRLRPMDAHDVTLLRAQFSVFRYSAAVKSREVLEAYPNSFYKHETLHSKCPACNRLDGRQAPADEIELFPPAECTCETANYSVTPHIDWLADID
jgi:hypothetical protein